MGRRERELLIFLITLYGSLYSQDPARSLVLPIPARPAGPGRQTTPMEISEGPSRNHRKRLPSVRLRNRPLATPAVSCEDRGPKPRHLPSWGRSHQFRRSWELLHETIRKVLLSP